MTDCLMSKIHFDFLNLSCKLIIVFDWFNVTVFYEISFCNIETIYRLFVI